MELIKNHIVRLFTNFLTYQAPSASVQYRSWDERKHQREETPKAEGADVRPSRMAGPKSWRVPERDGRRSHRIRNRENRPAVPCRDQAQITVPIRAMTITQMNRRW